MIYDSSMIKFNLKCDNGHGFESWFASGDAYDSLLAGGHVCCAVCASPRVKKAIMAPNVSTAKARDVVLPDAAGTEITQGPETLTPSPKEIEAALTRMRAEVEKNATYVGGNFAREARDMHLGDVPNRPIWGEANAKEAKALIEDGIPVAPLPFMPTRKVN